MKTQIKNGWYIVGNNDGHITLYNENNIIENASTRYLKVPKRYNIFVANDKITVSGAIKYSHPKLPKYLKEGILEFVNEFCGENDYRFSNK